MALGTNSQITGQDTAAAPSLAAPPGEQGKVKVKFLFLFIFFFHSSPARGGEEEDGDGRKGVGRILPLEQIPAALPRGLTHTFARQRTMRL